jgi:hypothetical protein
MKILLKSIIVAVAILVLLGTAPALSATPNPLPGAAPEDRNAKYLSGRASTVLAEIQKETAELLAEVQQESQRLRPQTHTLWNVPADLYETAPSHSAFLERAKGHIRAVGEGIAELQRMRLFLLPWQRQASTEVRAHARRVAASIQGTIAHLRENQNRLFVSEYRDHLTTIANHSGDMKQTVDKFLDYEKSPKEAHWVQAEAEPVGD